MKAKLEYFSKINKTSQSGAIYDQIKQDAEAIKDKDLKILKNETLLLRQKYESLSHENEEIKKNLHQINKVIYEDRNTSNMNTRLLTTEEWVTFSAFVNRTLGHILEDQNKANQKLNNISTKMSGKLYSSTKKPVAFYAYMSKHTPTITVQYPLTFDVVKTNIGNGYHSSTGVFIVPETGIYVFTWTIRMYGGYKHSTQLMVNTNEIGIIHADVNHDSDFSGSGIVVTHVNAGDNVFVRTHASWNIGAINSNSSGRSSFAGWKLS
ncbi:complement C1q-like protein 3 [Saccostrea cucullata]|uniref:complement C1q-like protein 3 n=1 Tax=Saccostrea cuccullata TaxID=36930 RepID=UPI002ED02788